MTTDKVLGTRDEFFQRMQSEPEEAALSQVSIKKYMQQPEGLPEVGSAFRDADVVGLDGTPTTLSAMARPGRPLLLNFGSCS